MFLRFYGLREQPFGVTPDPRFLYMGAAQREAFASLLYGIEAGRGFMALIAAPGMGKTTLVFDLMQKLRGSAITAFLFQIHMNADEFLRNLLFDLGCEPSGHDLSDLQRQLGELLVRESQAHRRFVVVIDEAQNLDDSILETVRTLSNFETPQSKLMQIILVGQPGLAEKLARPDLVQLRQRISVISHFPPLSPEETEKYIDHRLRVAGYKGGPLFTPKALELIAAYSKGVPRNINNLCFHALSLGYASGQKRIKRIGEGIVREAMADLDLEALRAGLNTAPGAASRKDEVRNGVRVAPRQGHTAARDLHTRAVQSQDLSGLSDFDIPIHTGSDSAADTRRIPPPAKSHPLAWSMVLVILALQCAVLWNNRSWVQLQLQPLEGFVGSLKARVITDVANRVTRQSAPPPAPAPPPAAAPSQQIASLPLGAAGTSAAKPAELPPDLTAVKPSPEVSGAPDQDTRSAAASSEGSNPDTRAATQSRAKERLEAPRPTTDVPGTGETASARRVSIRPRAVAARSVQIHPVSATGELTVRSTVRGARIRIDGYTAPGWIAPHSFSLASGNHDVSVTKEGYSTWKGTVHVGQRATRSVTADLTANDESGGLLIVETSPPGMQVFIDGKSYGTGRVQKVLSPGWHTCEVVPGFGVQPLVRRFKVESGEVLTRKFTVRVPLVHTGENTETGPRSQVRSNIVMARNGLE